METKGPKATPSQESTEETPGHRVPRPQLCSKSGGCRLYGSRGSASFGRAAQPANSRTEVVVVWYSRYRAASDRQTVCQDMKRLNLTTNQDRGPVKKLYKWSRDFGPIGTKLSKTHAAILAPSLQLLSDFQDLYLTICLYPTFLQKDIHMLPNMARMAGHAPKGLVRPFTVCSYCREADSKPRITFLSLPAHVVSCDWFLPQRLTRVTPSHAAWEAVCLRHPLILHLSTEEEGWLSHTVKEV